MSRSIRVLLADDSAAVRHMVADTLSSCSGIEVVGEARHGQEALTLIPQKKPDVILLDVEMPVMDGIDALRQIRRTDKKTPVLMFSSLTVAGAEATLDALALGASDYVAKPTGTKNAQEAIAYIKAQLVPRIREWAQLGRDSAGLAVRIVKPAGTAAGATTRTKPTGEIEVVAIGSSTGGPNALAAVVGKLPRDLSVPILIVQHMPTIFTKLLAERLDRASPLTIVEAQDGATIRPGVVLIAPGDYHMTVNSTGIERHVSLNQGPPENSCRPAIDVLFRSVADTYGKRSMGVVLTGMGKDGTEGCRAMSERGACILAQDQRSSVVWGMPRAIAEAGLADSVVPLKDIHSEIILRAGCRKKRRPVTVPPK